MLFVDASELRLVRRPLTTKIGSREISRLDKIREELDIPWKELNKLCRNVVSREDLKDARFLSVTEARAVIRYLVQNRFELRRRYHGIRFK